MGWAREIWPPQTGLVTMVMVVMDTSTGPISHGNGEGRPVIIMATLLQAGQWNELKCASLRLWQSTGWECLGHFTLQRWQVKGVSQQPTFLYMLYPWSSQSVRNKVMAAFKSRSTHNDTCQQNRSWLGVGASLWQTADGKWWKNTNIGGGGDIVKLCAHYAHDITLGKPGQCGLFYFPFIFITPAKQAQVVSLLYYCTEI